MHVSRLIPEYLADALPSATAARAREHLRGCDACRAQYDLAAEALRAAAGRAPTRTEQARVWRGVDAALDQTTASPTPARSLWFARVATAVLLALLALGVALWLARPPSPSGVRLKGGTLGALPAELTVYAIGEVSGGYGAPRTVADGGRLALSELVQFGYRNEDRRLGYLYLVGLDQRFFAGAERAQPLEYYPRPDRQRSIAIERSASTRTFGRSIRLAVRHRAGPLRVVGLFSERPLSRAAVRRALSRVAQAPDQLAEALQNALRPAAGHVVAVVRRLEVGAAGPSALPARPEAE